VRAWPHDTTRKQYHNSVPSKGNARFISASTSGVPGAFWMLGARLGTWERGTRRNLPQIFKSPSQPSVLQQPCQASIVALDSLQPPSQLVTRTTHSALVPAKSPERRLGDSATTSALSPSLSPCLKAAERRIASGSTAQRAPSCAAAAPCWH
jgi:hypothetical protein